MTGFPDAWYLILSSRLIPDSDGGYTISTLARARQMADAGASALLLTVDPGSVEAHAEHRAEFVRRGAAAASEAFRNLFDEAAAPDGGAAGWLRAAARPGETDPTLEYRSVAAGAVDLPNVVDPHWHLSTAPIVVRDGAGGTIGVIDGFGALYRAWLADVVAGLRAEIDRPVVVICESRQLGELIVDWQDADVRILHTVHTIHLESPYTEDAPINALWERWFAVAPRFDAVLWPTPWQLDDVRARFGDARVDVVAPHGIPAPDEVVYAADGPVVMLGRLAPGKRLDHAIRAFAHVVDELPDARLELWGAGAGRDSLEALVAELGLGDAVSLPGLTLDPGGVLDSAAVYLTTSAFEGQGLALAEALVHGVPVVAYDIRYGPRDMLARGGGVLVPDGDERALAEALARLLTDAALRQRLAADARAAAAALAPERAMRTLAAAATEALSRPTRR
jgi:glycosyltransferase involved in cell wall biosynthesis